MTEGQSHPTYDEICVVLALMADRVAAEQSPTLDPIIVFSLKRAINELRSRHIPGLFVPPDGGAAAALETQAAEAMHCGRARLGLSRALHGLSFSLHHPGLWHLSGSACLHLGAVETAVRCWQYCEWVHPGFEPAKRDLEALATWENLPLDPATSESDKPDPDRQYPSDYDDEYVLDDDQEDWDDGDD